MADGAGTQHLDLGEELVVDLFAGGGGASLGLDGGYRHPDVAVNHNPVAVAVHYANHPSAKHYISDVFEVDPVSATGGRPVGVLWASPDCRHHSKAKGGQPRSKKIRALAWVVIKWAAACRPRVIALENVEEFGSWGPLDGEGRPCPDRKGLTFRRWKRQLENLGYRVEHRELVAADYGTPTIRKRLYVIARCDGRPIVWPATTHDRNGQGGLPRWRAASECIDWTLSSKSIFDRVEPLVENTQRRIAKGLWRYVLAADRPFVVPAAQGAQSACIATLRGTTEAHLQGDDIAEPLSTVAAQGTHHALIAAHVTKFRANSVGSAITDPLHTVTAGGDMRRPAGAAHAMGLVSAYLVPRYGERSGQEPRAISIEAPSPTVVPTGNGGSLVTAFFEQANGGFYNGDGRDAFSPVSTICASGANQRLVSAYLVKYYGAGGQWQGCEEPMHTVPTRDRMGLVSVEQVPAPMLSPDQLRKARKCAAFLRAYLPEHFKGKADIVVVGGHVLVDIALRMLVPRELARAQGFPDSYVLDRGLFQMSDGTTEWRPISKTDQVRLIGNSVCPPVAKAIIAANCQPLNALYERMGRAA